MTIIIPEAPGTPDATEIDFMRINTKVFIDADPISLSLTHRTRTRSAEGGWQNGAPGLPAAQMFRLIPLTDVATSVQTPDGVQLMPAYVLLGQWDSDMRRWDTFTLNDVEYAIVSPIRPEFRDEAFVYERKADVARL